VLSRCASFAIACNRYPVIVARAALRWLIVDPLADLALCVVVSQRIRL
jgi:hypothetical protein